MVGWRSWFDLSPEIFQRGDRSAWFAVHSELSGVAWLCAGEYPGDGLDLGRGVDADGLSCLGTRIDPTVIAGDRVV